MFQAEITQYVPDVSSVHEVTMGVDSAQITPLRIPTTLIPHDDFYEGDCLKIFDGKSCAYGAMVNVIYALGGEASSLLQQDVLTEIMAASTDNAFGTDLGELYDLMRAHSECAIVSIPKEESTLCASPTYADMDAVTKSARFVQEVIGNNDGLLVGLTYPDNTRHMVAVVGYEVTEEGFMNVQCLDSALESGSLLVPLECLLFYLTPGHCDASPSVLRIQVETPEIEIIEI